MHLVFTHNVQDETKSSVFGCLGETGNVALSTSVLHKIEVREKMLRHYFALHLYTDL